MGVGGSSPPVSTKNLNIMKNMKNYLYCIGIAILIIVISYLIIGYTNTKPDVIISKDSEAILVKEYYWNNSDSCIHKYPADKIYQGLILNKRRHSRYIGVPGKGGHRSMSYHVIIFYNGDEHTIKSFELYRKYNRGDQVTVKEVWYPRHDIIIY